MRRFVQDDVNVFNSATLVAKTDGVTSEYPFDVPDIARASIGFLERHLRRSFPMLIILRSSFPRTFVRSSIAIPVPRRSSNLVAVDTSRHRRPPGRSSARVSRAVSLRKKKKNKEKDYRTTTGGFARCAPARSLVRRWNYRWRRHSRPWGTVS